MTTTIIICCWRHWSNLKKRESRLPVKSLQSLQKSPAGQICCTFFLEEKQPVVSIAKKCRETEGTQKTSCLKNIISVAIRGECPLSFAFFLGQLERRSATVKVFDVVNQSSCITGWASKFGIRKRALDFWLVIYAKLGWTPCICKYSCLLFVHYATISWFCQREVFRVVVIFWGCDIEVWVDFQLERHAHGCPKWLQWNL